MTQLDIPTAAARLADLVAAAIAGEEVVITDAAGRGARPVPANESPSVPPNDNPRDRGRGLSAGQVWVADDFDAPLPPAEVTPAVSALDTPQLADTRSPDPDADPPAAAHARGFGLFAGQVWMSDDCFDPMTDEELKEWALL